MPPGALCEGAYNTIITRRAMVPQAESDYFRSVMVTGVRMRKVMRVSEGKVTGFPREASEDDDERNPPPPPAKTTANALMDKFPAFDPSWSPEIQTKWFEAFAKMQDMVKDA